MSKAKGVVQDKPAVKVLPALTVYDKIRHLLLKAQPLYYPQNATSDTTKGDDIRITLQTYHDKEKTSSPPDDKGSGKPWEFTEGRINSALNKKQLRSLLGFDPRNHIDFHLREAVQLIAKYVNACLPDINSGFEIRPNPNIKDPKQICLGVYATREFKEGETIPHLFGVYTRMPQKLSMYLDSITDHRASHSTLEVECEDAPESLQSRNFFLTGTMAYLNHCCGRHSNLDGEMNEKDKKKDEESKKGQGSKTKQDKKNKRRKLQPLPGVEPMKLRQRPERIDTPSRRRKKRKNENELNMEPPMYWYAAKAKRKIQVGDELTVTYYRPEENDVGSSEGGGSGAPVTNSANFPGSPYILTYQQYCARIQKNGKKASKSKKSDSPQLQCLRCQEEKRADK